MEEARGDAGLNRREVVLENGVLAFDGEVVEAFTGQGSDRVPVSQVKSVEADGTSLRILCEGFLKPMTMPLAASEAEGAELKDLLNEIQGVIA